MTDTGFDCPDCGVSMESMDLRTQEGFRLRFVSDEKREGILGKLGAKQTYDAETVVCPECGLSRVYADFGDDESDAADASGSSADERSSADDDGGWTFE